MHSKHSVIYQAFFAVNIVEHVRPGTTFVQADTLMYLPPPGVYVVDPDFKESEDPKDHRANMNLLFTIEAQPLVECEELYEGEKAWRIEHRAPEAARARAAIEAAGDDSESGEEREMQFD